MRPEPSIVFEIPPTIRQRARALKRRLFPPAPRDSHLMRVAFHQGLTGGALVEFDGMARVQRHDPLVPYRGVTAERSPIDTVEEYEAQADILHTASMDGAAWRRLRGK